jgi:hypothetical protein
MKPLPLDAAPAVVGWTVSAQDWRGRLPGSRAKLPKTTKQWFSTREEAEQHKAHLRELNQSPNVLICVTPAKFKQGRIKEKPKPAQHGSMDWAR